MFEVRLEDDYSILRSPLRDYHTALRILIDIDLIIHLPVLPAILWESCWQEDLS